MTSHGVGSSVAEPPPVDPEVTRARPARVALAAAAARVEQNLPPALAHVSADIVSQHLGWLQSIALGDEPPSPDGETGATFVLRRRLLTQLRSRLLDGVAYDTVDPAVLVHALRALERAEAACAPKLDQAFAAELADLGGMDLVVEVAHDMRSPLTSILFLSEILHRDQAARMDPVQKRQIGIIYSAALGLVALTTDMLEMAKAGSSHATRQPVPFSVNEILYALQDLVRPMAEEKGIEFRVSHISSANRIGHPIAISRVLLNLSTNALKFTQSGHVEVSATPIGGTRLEFSVRDTGPGIPPHAMENLYEPFRPQPSRESGYHFSGTGLGLAICRRLVNGMGAELEIETASGWGTRFSFIVDLPAAPSL
ncbi:MAG TPA: HAMP domain-containing sensor histidine kinase [Longimicrobiales bacterium]